MLFRYEPQIPTVVGAGAINKLGDEMARLGCNSPLCVFGSGVLKAGVADRALQSLKKAGMQFSIFSQVAPDPTTKDVDAVAMYAGENHADSIIGIGGGSNMDAAKAASIMLGKPGHASEYLTMPVKRCVPSVPIILIPTTSGSGSEASNACVIINETTGIKVPSMVESALAIVDPELTLSLPLAVTVNSAADAFSHAVEAILSKAWNPRVEALGLAALERIFRWLPVVCNRLGSLEGRSELAYASNLAGQAMRDAAPHVGHGIADAYAEIVSLPHGLPCAWATPEVIELLAPVFPDRVEHIALAMGLAVDPGDLPQTVGEKTAAAYRSFMRRVGICSPRDLHIQRGLLLEHAASVMPMSHLCPVEISLERAEKLLGNTYDHYQ